MSNVLAARFASHTPLLISSDKADWMSQALPQVTASVERLEVRANAEPIVYAGIDTYWPAPDNWLSAYRPYNVVNGTLMIPIKGMLLHDFTYQLGSWATGYIYILKAFERGMQDPDVERIAMLMDSPGGEVAGCFDSVDKIFAMRGTKPIQAFVNEMAYSAAYAWATVADKITMTRTGGVGSVGVVTAHMDVSKAMEKAGYKITFIHAGKHKVDGNSYEALPPAVEARIKKRIDSMYNIFVATTARNLGIEEAAVRDTEALTYDAEDALTVGFAHEVMPFDEAMAAFSGELDETAGEDNVELTAEQKAAHAADIASAKESARAEGHAAGLAEGTTAGAAAEQTRIKGIVAHASAEGKPKMAMHLALNTKQSVEEAVALLDVSQPEAAATKPAQGADFNAAMGQDNPNLGSGDDGGDKPNETAEATTLNEYRAVNGFKERT